MKSQIISSLKQSFQIKNKKLLFAGLFVLQALTVIFVSWIFAHYYLIIVDLLAKMMQSLEGINAENMVTLQQSMVMQLNYKVLFSTFLQGMFLLYLVYIVINGINWDLSNLFVNKKLKFPIYLVQYGILAFIFTIPAIFVFRIILRSLLDLDFFYPMKLISVGIILVTWYFMMIAFALINKYEIKQIKEHLKQTFVIGYKKAKILIPAYLIIILIMSAFFSIVYYLQDSAYLSVMILSIILLMLAVVWCRIYFLTTMKNLS
jgi:hypothetical protein